MKLYWVEFHTDTKTFLSKRPGFIKQSLYINANQVLSNKALSQYQLGFIKQNFYINANQALSNRASSSMPSKSYR